MMICDAIFITQDTGHNMVVRYTITNVFKKFQIIREQKIQNLKPIFTISNNL